MSMKFEDLEAWKEARALTKDVYSLTRVGPISKDHRLCSQIQASAVSVMSNLAEGFERSGNAEKLHFYNIARASCGEVRSQLYVIEDVYQECAQEAFRVRGRVETVGRLVTGLIASTRRRSAVKR
jgi:four helix bundle protein